MDVSTVSFTQDAKYTIGIFNDTEQWGVSINYGGWPYGDVYVGGSAYFSGQHGEHASDDADLVFHVGSDNVSQVPEPSTLLLLGSGLAGLGLFGRKAFRKD